MTRRNLWLWASVIAVGLAATSQAQSPKPWPGADVAVHDGFISGLDVKAFDARGRARYVAGVIDGMLMAPAFGAPQESVAVLEECVKHMSSTQIADLLTQELNDHPEVRASSAHKTLYRVLAAKCTK